MAYYPTARYSVNNGRIKVTLSDAPYARMVAVAHMVAAYLTIQGISDGASIREEHGRIILEGTVPSPIDPPSGCRFHPRCFARVGAICENEDPVFTQISDSQRVACHLYG